MSVATSPLPENADYVSRFKKIYESTPNAGVVTYEGIPLPASVTGRLNDIGLSFKSLPNLMRQALLWDMGYIVGEMNGVDMFMQVLVPKNSTMASIVFKWSEYVQSSAAKGLEQTACALNGQTYYRQKVMAGADLLPNLKCAVDLVSVDGQSSLLAQDALPSNVIPEPRLYKHQDATQGWTLLAIHTLPRKSTSGSGEVGWGECPKDANHQALIIPCEPKFLRSDSQNKFPPDYSTTMTSWLKEFKKSNPDLSPDTANNTTPAPSTSEPPQSRSSNDVALIVGVALGAVIILGSLLIFLLRRRRSTTQQRSDSESQLAETPESDKLTSKYSATTQNTSGDLSAPYQQAMAHEGINLAAISLYRIDQNAIEIQRPLGSGAFAEVLLGSYNGKCVAVKRLHPGHASIKDVQALIDEIVLLSGFSSAYIIEFVGAAWDKPIELACVMEYMDMGDLRHQLDHRSSESFSWDEKLDCIYSIVEGLVYLHSFPIIHRDLKSRNVLMDSKKGAKLTDFGVSREQTQETMTNAVGTGRWMAPEILKYNHYSVAADIYSFGMILSELSTHRVPYSDRMSTFDGKPLIDTAIMAMVVSNEIKPTFDPSMPKFLLELAHQCIQHNPTDRPTSFMLSHILRKHKSFSL